MKPGPATETAAMSASLPSSAAIRSASWRGFIFASRASAMAALVARSPWLASRGGSTTTRERSSPVGRWPAAARRSREAAIRAVKRSKIFMCCNALAAHPARLNHVMCRKCGLLRPRLSQQRGGVKQPGMLIERIAVCHAGNIVADTAGGTAFIKPVEALRPFRRHG